jgi:hypothetical protein
MNKQNFISTSTSISEAVSEYVKGLDAEYQDHAADDFIAGAAWQKEQGIDWISARTGSLVENLPPQHQRVLCCTTSGYMTIGYLDGNSWMYDAKSCLFSTYGYTITHFAYINQPKPE